MAKWALYRRRRDGKQSHPLEGAYIRGELRILEYKPPPQSGPCLPLEKGGLIFGRIRYMYNMQHTNFERGGEFPPSWPYLCRKNPDPCLIIIFCTTHLWNYFCYKSTYLSKLFTPLLQFYSLWWKTMINSCIQWVLREIYLESAP
jgi:hypothetical protein